MSRGKDEGLISHWIVLSALSVFPDQHQHSFLQLHPNTRYSVSIHGETETGNFSKASLDVNTPLIGQRRCSTDHDLHWVQWRLMVSDYFKSDLNAETLVNLGCFSWNCGTVSHLGSWTCLHSFDTLMCRVTFVQNFNEEFDCNGWRQCTDRK